MTTLREYALTLLVTAAVTYLLTPLVRRGAIAVGAMHAARDRDVHVVPIPLLGGLAIYAGLAAGLLVAGQLTPLRTVYTDSPRMATGLLLAGGLIVLIGMADDRWGLSPISKLAAQAAAGGILVWSGAQLSWLPEPGQGTLALTPNQSTALTILVVVATINAVNFIDGLDGLAAGIVCIAALAFFVYYYRLTQLVHLPLQAGPTLASAVLAGACLGFLPHNFYPARIFMGDTGSMLLGLLLAYVPISSIASLDPASLRGSNTVNRFPEILPLLLPAAIMVIPYADLLLAVVRRTRAGRSPLAPDRKHLHHRLLDIGHSHRSSVHDHVPVGHAVRRRGGLAVHRQDPAVRAGRDHGGGRPAAPDDVDAEAALVGEGEGPVAVPAARGRHGQRGRQRCGGSSGARARPDGRGELGRGAGCGRCRASGWPVSRRRGRRRRAPGCARWRTQGRAGPGRGERVAGRRPARLVGRSCAPALTRAGGPLGSPGPGAGGRSGGPGPAGAGFRHGR